MNKFKYGTLMGLYFILEFFRTIALIFAIPYFLLNILFDNWKKYLIGLSLKKGYSQEEIDKVLNE
jgi:hypothetical protein